MLPKLISARVRCISQKRSMHSPACREARVHTHRAAHTHSLVRMHHRQQALFSSRTLGSDVAKAYMYSRRSAMNIVRAEQSMRGWIVRASPGVLFCSTCCCLSLSCLTTVRRCPQIFSNASCFALGADLRGIRSIVFLLAMALLALSPPPGAEVEAQPRPPKKCNPRQR